MKYAPPVISLSSLFGSRWKAVEYLLSGTRARITTARITRGGIFFYW
jgi:hypothetical protein